jgi:hypothetical protein
MMWTYVEYSQPETMNCRFCQPRIASSPPIDKDLNVRMSSNQVIGYSSMCSFVGLK